jgi:hypothetical protein
VSTFVLAPRLHGTDRKEVYIPSFALLLHYVLLLRYSISEFNFICHLDCLELTLIKKTIIFSIFSPWSEFMTELYRPSDRRLSVKSVPNSVVRGCHVVSVTDPYGYILGSLDRSRYIFFQVAPQLY